MVMPCFVHQCDAPPTKCLTLCFLVNSFEQSNLADLTMSVEKEAETIRAYGQELQLVLNSIKEMMNELQKCLALRCSGELLSRSKRKATTKAEDEEVGDAVACFLVTEFSIASDPHQKVFCCLLVLLIRKQPRRRHANMTNDKLEPHCR
jgi:hypothetical protein